MMDIFVVRAGRRRSESNVAHADPKAVGVNSVSLREAMEKWIDQASMREGKALDIARAWLDQKYLKRTLKRMAKNAAPGSASSASWSK